MIVQALRRWLAAGATLAAALGMVAATPAAAETAQQQAVVALAGTAPVLVPGVHLQALLDAVHVEVVTGDTAALTALAQQPGVLGVAPNVAVDVAGFAYGRGGRGGGHDGGAQGGGTDQSSSGSSGAADTSSDSGSSPIDGVLAPTTLGAPAGQPGAGAGVTVALIDTGVSDTPALDRASGRLVDAVDTSGLNTRGGHVVENGTFTDGYGHGTFMASLIAGGVVDGTNGTALGVAPGATVDVVKVADDTGRSSLAAVIAGLNWVATHANSVDVANLSMSVTPPTSGYGIDPLNFAVTLTRYAGVTVVVASGNTPGVVGDPGFSPDALTVGAADTTGDTPVVANFSGYGNVDGIVKPDVVAAGVNILGEMPADTVIAQQFPNGRQPNGLFRGSGTSQSTAIVSGLAALYLQAHPHANPWVVKSAIRNAATPIQPGYADGQGLVGVPGDGDARPLNTGEQGLNLRQWFSTVSYWAPVWPLARMWGARMWDARMWDARMWDARMWDARMWDARMWDARMWDARMWDARMWDARMWDARMWDARMWDARMWDARMWDARMWDAVSWGDGS
ncbi:MAG: S8 family peptidase [Acidothermus cellulolyticus]|nr:S8 family peptidase [Acidothermus cellulolyticus]